MKLVIILLITSCSLLTPRSQYEDIHTNHQEMSRQRLTPRPGHEGSLTNRICRKWEGSECKEVSVISYDLNDPNVRYQLNEFKFACNVAGSRYRVCLDRAGLCRTEMTQECKKWGKTFFRRATVCREWGNRIDTKFIDINASYQFLINAATECRAGL